MSGEIGEVALSVEAQRLYMNYALSVISARALPDVRDGLKPVQRRILFTMHQELRVGPDSKPVKCARIVGDVIGKYHPHGDVAVYDALVRLAQSWVLRNPLIQGQGNFGSIDGDGAAAYRYTEARLEALAMELLVELPKKTVNYRPNFDGTRSEPVVLPARFPNLLVNGSQGIAVGMATSIPPHNLGEVIDACEALIDDENISVAKLLQKMKGPDFPTGGELLSTRAELKEVYETGQGTLKLRGEWKIEEKKGQEKIVIVGMPYGVEKSGLIEKIAEVILSKKLPGLIDVRDESTDEIRVVLETKKDTNLDLVLAYLQKHTPLLTNVSVNLTCLVPSPENPEIPVPQRLDLKSILRYFLDFRYEVIRRRLEHELDELTRRLHILQGFEKVFDALDEIIKIIRKSDGKADAAEKIMKRFGIDEEQTDAILELKLYRLAKLEILIIQKEAEEKRNAARAIGSTLRTKAKVWKLVKDELLELKKDFADKRRTKIVTAEQETEFTAEDFIVDEDALVIVTENGWVKRQGTVKDLSATRIKEGDRVLACVAGSTRSTVAFFSSKGHAYVCRIADLPASTGYGDPIQKLFKFDDGEGVVGAVSFDPRLLAMPEEEKTLRDGSPGGPYGLAVTKGGLALRFPLFPHKEVSTRAGRKFAKLNEGDAVLTCFAVEQNDKGFVIAATTDGHGIAVPVAEIALLSGAGKGTMLIKVEDSAVLAAKRAPSPRTEPLVVRTESGKKFELFAESLEGPRGGRGKALVKRSTFASVEHELPEVPALTPNGG
ncbi:MAG: DNA topoisomerase IV subunit A [Deltaproteobacteria bacterium]|nr:DNA topoisomerase IV subunit A [Deltaproteobacteria bacterium]